jgi:glucose-1-phosphate thymidylyltransferase
VGPALVGKTIDDTIILSDKPFQGGFSVSETLKIAIPMAGLGTRMRPHTWSKPKPLIALAGKTVLDYVLEQFNSLENPDNVEYVFIVGPYQLEQVQAHLSQHYPEKKVHFVIQEKMRGQSDALYLAREFLTGPMLMAFSDTLVETDLSQISCCDLDGMAWVRPVPDPRRFGVAHLNEEGYITRLIEKPTDMSNNLVVVGFYFFQHAEKLMAAIEEQMRRNLTLKNEFFLADAVNILLEGGAKMRTQQVDVWMDAGMPDALLETNRYLLEHGHDNSAEAVLAHPDVAIIPPVFIAPNAQVTSSVIGPYVSVGEDCNLNQVVVTNSILEEGAHIEHMILDGSHLGRDVQVNGQVTRLNLGDQSWAMS